jgi:hypothetical protein
MDGHQPDEKTAWARLFLRQASKRGYTIEDIVALLDETWIDGRRNPRAASVR